VKTLRGMAVTAGAVALAALAVTGCDVEFNPGADSETKTYDIPGSYPSLRINGDSGPVEIVGTDRQGIRVTEHLRWSNENNKPRTERTVRNGTLSLSHKCARNVIGYNACGASYRVEIPRKTAASVHTDSGRLTVSDISGDTVRLSADSGRIEARGLRTKTLHVESDSGRIDLEGQADSVTLSAESGAIDAPALRARTVRASADSGKIELGLTTAPDSIDASAESGLVKLILPDVPEGYAMSLNSDSGGRSIDPELRRNDTSPHSIKVRTDSGLIDIETPLSG
jgi:DUF4097 and DUF4098 domain-containing protein YvlB